jgi:hypothetical protein
MVKRYDCTGGRNERIGFCQGCYTMTEDTGGDYVTYEDYAKLEARLNERSSQLIESLRSQADACPESVK